MTSSRAKFQKSVCSICGRRNIGFQTCCLVCEGALRIDDNGSISLKNDPKQKLAPESKCNSCGEYLSPEMAFCTNCGTEQNAGVASMCNFCGADIDTDQSFCIQCGKKIQ